MNAFKKLEIVEFYLIENDPKKKSFWGTLHVYFPDLDLDLRGIWAGHTAKNGWKVNLPVRKALDPESGKEVRFSIVSFCNKENQKALEKIILNESMEIMKEKRKGAPIMINEKKKFNKGPKSFKPDFQKPKSSFSKMPLNAFVSMGK